LEVEIFKPKDIDTQSPHEKDELYFIIRGNAYFFHNGETTAVKEGDLLFVPAGDEHRFERFSDDFSVWVSFYGRKGGELKDLKK